MILFYSGSLIQFSNHHALNKHHLFAFAEMIAKVPF